MSTVSLARSPLRRCQLISSISQIPFKFDASIIPILFVLSIVPLAAIYKLRTYLAKKEKTAALHAKGIGKNVPGFLTGSKRVQLPPDIILRIQLGEEVTGEEITAALDKIKADEEKARAERVKREEYERRTGTKVKEGVDVDFLPAVAGGGKSRRRK